jgi:branched-chain amino acid transport system substrate-binding protein
MRAFHLILTACLIFSLQGFLTRGVSDLSDPQTPQGGLTQLPHVDLKSDPQTPQGGLKNHQDNNRDSQGGLYYIDQKSPLGDLGVDHTIRIGLLLPDQNSLAARNGAELAINNANRKGGKNEIEFELVVRSMEGPWGTGSKQAVTMIFDEDVVAILGSHDGRNAHLVEQVSAKSRVVFLSAWSGDPTLAQAFVPWFFNCVPNDLQQADALIEEIYNKRKLTNIVLVSDKSYDSQSELNNFLKKVTMEGRAEPLRLSYDSAGTDINDLADKIISHQTGCVLIFVQPPAAFKIIEKIKLKKMNLPVYGPLALLDENLTGGKTLKDYEDVAFVSSVNLSGKAGIVFSDDYRKTYGKIPGAVAAYAFDGMNILIEAIRKAGTERENIQKAIAEIKYEGVTGTIQFDDKGNRKGTPGFVEIKDGIPVSRK